MIKHGKSFDIIYADPPYHEKGDKNAPFSLRVLEIVDSHPQLLKAEGHLFLEDAIELNAKLSTLTLKTVRHLGKSVLHEYGLLPASD